MNQKKWTSKIQCQTLRDLMKAFCNLGNKIGSLYHWLEPHSPQKWKYWYLDHLTKKWQKTWKSCSSDNSQWQYSIPKAQTHPYTLWELNICLGHRLLSYFLLSTLITTYNLVFDFFYAVKHNVWQYSFSSWTKKMDNKDSMPIINGPYEIMLQP